MVVDYSLRGDSLADWNGWLDAQRSTEWLLSIGIAANRVAATVSLPFWMLATLIRVPLSVLSMVTGGLLFWPFHTLLVRPLMFLALTTSQLWSAVPPARPLLIVFGPLLTMLSMTVISLIPDGNPDHLSARMMLIELWPLSSRRLEWIAERGTGAPATSNA